METRPLPAVPPAPILVAYFPLNDPKVPLKTLDIYAAAGVNVVELGLKAADPSYDGKIVRSSMERALGTGAVEEAWGAADYLRQNHPQMMRVLFCYPETPVRRAADEWQWLDGVLCLATDADKQDEVACKAMARGARRVEFLAHGFGDGDLLRANRADGYVMVQYSPGKTGIRNSLSVDLGPALRRVWDHDISVPIVTGVGISTADQARYAMDTGADGIVIGSKLVRMAAKSPAAIADYLGGMREVLNGA